MLIALLIAVALPALAAAAPVESLSLAQALETARTRNPGLSALREQARAVEARARSARRLNLPRLGVEAQLDATNNAAAAFASRLNAGEFRAQDFEIRRLNAPEAIGHLGGALFIEAPIDLAHRIALSADAQTAAGRALGHAVDDTADGLGLAVFEAYFGQQLAERAVVATERAVAAARSREAATEARFSEGAALQADVLRVRARRRERESDLAARRADVSLAAAALASLIGAPPGARFALVDPLPDKAPSPADLTEWLRLAQTERPALRAAGESEKAATLGVQIEKRASWPEVAAQARLMGDRIGSGGSTSWIVGAQVRWTAFDASRDKRRAAARAEADAAALSVRATRDRVNLEVESAWHRLEAARARFDAAAGGAAEGRGALRVVQERRAQGAATLTDELETDAAAFAAELEEIQAARAAVLAEAALRRAAGLALGSTK